MTSPQSIRKEYETISAMIYLYCRAQHQTEGGRLCSHCAELLAYAKSRLDRCPYAMDKPVCSACPSHCYKPERRRQIQQVMRYAGQRMMRTHPLLAIRHLLRKLKKPKV